MPGLVVMDSRGRGLQKRFDVTAPGVVNVVGKGGGNLPTLLKLANRTAVREERKYNVIIIARGICSVTKLDKKGQAKLRFKTIQRLLEEVSTQMKTHLMNLRGDNPRSSVILAPTVGIDLERYNGIKPKRKTQRKLNRMVIAVNKMLIDNNKPGSRILWISRMVHAYKSHSTWSHKYKHLEMAVILGLR